MVINRKGTEMCPWQELLAKWSLWILVGSFSVFGHSSAFAAKVTVPFVGCPSNVQGVESPAPEGTPKQVDIEPAIARQLAYYATNANFGIFAPRGWVCEGNGGSSQFRLHVSPTADDSGNGPAVVDLNLTGDYPNRERMAQYFLKLFPPEGRNWVKRLHAR